MVVRRLALSLAVSVASFADGSGDADLHRRIEQMRAVLRAENGKLELIERYHARRLRGFSSPYPPSIHGDANPGHRPYNLLEVIEGALDHFWLLVCGTWVFFMQFGFAMVQAGFCRAKSLESILLKNLTNVAVGTFGWYLFGWSFAFSGPMRGGFKENRFAGSQQFAGHHFVKDVPALQQLEPTTDMLNWYFQWARCATVVAISSSGIAERADFVGYLIFSFCMSTFIYPIVVAWTWGFGFLADMNQVGYMDFAGSGTVHLTGGIAALVGAAIAGQRDGRFPEDWDARERMGERPEDFEPPRSQLQVALGTFLLWFGWYGFNCGATLSMKNAEKGFLAAHVAMNTTLAASVGGLTVVFLRRVLLGRFDIGGFCNGILAGLVSITAGCGNVDTGVAVFIGLFGGFIFQSASCLVKAAKVDDPLDAFAVHGACGIWGVLAAGLFDWGAGFHHAHGWNGFKCNPGESTVGGPCGPEDNNLGTQMFVANLCEVIVTILWSGGLSAMVFAIMKVAATTPCTCWRVLPAWCQRLRPEHANGVRELVIVPESGEPPRPAWD